MRLNENPGPSQTQHTWSLGLISSLLQLGSVCLLLGPVVVVTFSDIKSGESFPRIFVGAILDYFFPPSNNLYVEM